MKTLLICADATREIGTGHMMRCLALAQAWQKRGGKAVFLSHCESDALCNRILAEGFDLIRLEENWSSLSGPNYILDICRKLNALPEMRDTWFIVDGYHFDDVFRKKIMEIGYPLLLIDDFGQSGQCSADIILNQNVLASGVFYQCRECNTLLLGPSYTLVRKDFQPWRERGRQFPDVADKILVTMGGADPDNLTLEVVRALRRLELSGLEVKVVVGHTNANYECIREECEAAGSGFNVLFSVDNVPELMAWADLAIIQAGGTLWELLFMGCAVISYATNQLQEEILRALEKMNILKYQGFSSEMNSDVLLSSIHEIASDKGHRQEMATLGMQIIDGQGTERVLDSIDELSTSRRPSLTQ